MSMMFKLCSKR